MTFSRYILLMLFATALCWGAWYAVITIINPAQADMLGFALFYGSLALSLAGTFALCGIIVRSVFFKHETGVQRVAIAFRQGIFFALLMDGFLLLQSKRLLTWYNVAFLIIALSIVELFFMSRKTITYRH